MASSLDVDLPSDGVSAPTTTEDNIDPLTSSKTIVDTTSDPSSASPVPSASTVDVYLGAKSNAVTPDSGVPTEPSTSASASPTTEDVPAATSSKNIKASADEEKKDDSMYECNICLDTAKDAVISMCGHLFCWGCLHQWLETRPRRQLCPVCKAAISKEKVIPLYGRGSTNQQDPRTKVPPRPQGQRTEPEPSSGGFQGFGMNEGGFHMSFGIGAFPISYLSTSFNFDGRARNGNYIMECNEMGVSRSNANV